MDEAVRKEKLCYHQFIKKGEGPKFWKNKDSAKSTIGEKQQKPSYLKIFGKNHQWKNFNKGNVNQLTHS